MQYKLFRLAMFKFWISLLIHTLIITGSTSRSLSLFDYLEHATLRFHGIVDDGDTISNEELQKFYECMVQIITPYLTNVPAESFQFTFGDNSLNVSEWNAILKFPHDYALINTISNMEDLTFSTTLYIPEFEGTGNYSLNVDSPYVTAFGNDTLGMNISDIIVDLAMILNYVNNDSADDTIQLKQIKIEYSLNNPHITINNLMNDPTATEVINKFINTVIPTLMLEYQQEIQDILTSQGQVFIGTQKLSDFVSLVKNFGVLCDV